jgi:hypothetical protein
MANHKLEEEKEIFAELEESLEKKTLEIKKIFEEKEKIEQKLETHLNVWEKEKENKEIVKKSNEVHEEYITELENK